ncbi:MAG: hypothetical protein ACTHU0_27695 [Kofleriaceae bacterium]
MHPRMMIAFVLLAACGRGEPSSTSAAQNELPPEVAKLTENGAPFRGIVVGPAGVYFAGQKTSDLQRALEQAGHADPTATLRMIALASATAPSIVTTLEAVKSSGWARFDLLTLDGGRPHMLCDMNWSEPATDPNRIIVSIDLRADRVFVGRSQVNEFYELPNRGTEPDFEKLGVTLKEQRNTPEFDEATAGAPLARRRDAQLAVAPGIATAQLLKVLDVICDAGFNDLAIVAPEALAARASR